MPGGLPNDPISDITATTTPNADLAGSGTFPSLSRITVVDKVGPRAANRQHAAHEQRAETLRAAVNQLIDNSNVVDEIYLRRDSSTQKDSTSGLTDDLDAGDNKVANMAAGTVAAASKDAVNGDQLYTEQQARASADSSLSASLAAKADITQLPTIHEYGVGSSTFTATVNCLVEISACAGGGGGANDNSGSGGAGAGLHKLLVALSPGDTVALTIGAGGGVSGDNGVAGGNTQIDVLISSVYQHRILLGGGQGGVWNAGSAASTALGGSCYVMMDLMTGSLSQWVAVAAATASSPGQTTSAGGPAGAGPYVSGGNGTPNSNSGGGNNSHSGGSSIFAGSRSNRNSIKGAGGAAGQNSGGHGGYTGGDGYAVLVVTPR